MYKTGILLTTKRVVVSAVVRDVSCFSLFLPESMNCCCPTTKGVLTRSLFPAEVRAGYVKRSRAWLQGAILTDCGVIELNFYQCDARAEEGGETAITGDIKLPKRLKFLSALARTPSRSVAFPNALENPDITVNSLEERTMPMFPGEKKLASYEGKVYDDLPPICCCITTCRNKTWPCFPNVPWALSCGLSPYFSRERLLLTNSTILTFHERSDPAPARRARAPLRAGVRRRRPRRSNDPCCILAATECCLDLFKVTEFAMYWAPIERFSGAKVETTLDGRETCFSRCCFGNCCGQTFCPKVQSNSTVATRRPAPARAPMRALATRASRDLRKPHAHPAAQVSVVTTPAFGLPQRPVAVTIFERF